MTQTTAADDDRAPRLLHTRVRIALTKRASARPWRGRSHQNAAACGTDVLSYICESPVVSAFALRDGGVYQTYTTTWRGLEVIMGYYPILDRAPKGRDEGDEDWQTWIRRHDEYAQP